MPPLSHQEHGTPRIPANGVLNALFHGDPAAIAAGHVAPSHVGLALDRYLPFLQGAWTFDSEHKGPWMRRFARAATEAWGKPEALWRDWARRHSELWRQVPGVVTRRIQPRWRWVVGLGEGTALETGLTLHHTYGVPVIRGSALKGLTRAFVELELAEGELKRRLDAATPLALFGNEVNDPQQAAGEVDFLGAIPVPEHLPRLEVDVMTPHFAQYYQGEAADPLENEDPIPVPFFVLAGGAYEAAFAPRRGRHTPPDLVPLAADLALAALDDLGVGGKTAKGYGYFHAPDPTPGAPR